MRSMLRRKNNRFQLATVLFTVCCGLLFAQPTTAQNLELPENANITIIGNTLADRMQHYPWLESYTQALHPNHSIVFRNLGFSGDEVNARQRSANFGSADQWLTKTKADVVLCFFGYNEALRGADTVDAFSKNLATMIDGMLAPVSYTHLTLPTSHLV